MTPRDSDINWIPTAKIDKYSDGQVALVRETTGIRDPEGASLLYFDKPQESVEILSDTITTRGFSQLYAILMGGPTATMDSTCVRLSVNDVLKEQSCVRVMDTTFPHQNNGIASFRVTFNAYEANFNWDTWNLRLTVPIDKSQSVLCDRGLYVGEKQGGVWVLTVSFAWAPAPVSSSARYR